jgi:hypothetical protein
MAKPLFTSKRVCEILRQQKLGVEIFDEFPQDMEKARHGIYVDSPATQDRTPYALAIHTGSNIYNCVDGMRIIFVSFQGDKNLENAASAISDLVIDNILMDGYHERDYTMSQQYVNRAEYRVYDFSLKRIELQ